MKVLVIEDDRRMADLLAQALREEGYLIASAFTGGDGFEMALGTAFDLIVLDVMLPEMNGFEMAKRLRERRIHTPILMLTARDAREDIIHGLDLGADDYLTKPFDLEVFLARVRAALRRGPASFGVILRSGPLELNTSNRSLRTAERNVPLSRTEYALLELLMRRRGQVVTRECLLEEIWGWDRSVESNTLDAFIRLLRTKIDSGNGPSLVQTVRGVGYRLDVGEN